MLSSAGGVRMDDSEGASYWAERHRVADFYEKGIAKSPFAEWRGHETFDFAPMYPSLRARGFRFGGGIVRIAKRRRITIDSYGILDSSRGSSRLTSPGEMGCRPTT